MILSILSMVATGARATLGLIAVAYLPGMLILHLIGYRNSHRSVQLPAEIAMSLVLLMCVGVVMNWAYPTLGIAQPLGQVPVVVTLAAVLALLIGLNLVFRKPGAASFPSWTNPTGFLSQPLPTLLCWCWAALTPFLALLATTLFTVRADNRLMIGLFLSIAGLTLAVALVDGVPTSLYPFTAAMIALSLLLARSLIGQYVLGWDIQWEYYFATRTAHAGLWAVGDSSSQLNSALSVVILPVFLTNITGFSITWVFKLVYPLFLSLTAPVLYQIYRRYATEREALLAVLFVVFLNVYYFALAQAVRMEVSFLFLTLILYFILSSNYNAKAALLTMLFIVGVVVAHYSTAFIFATWLVVSAFILLLTRPLLSWWYVRPSEKALASGGLIALTIVSSYAWYMYTSGGITMRESVGVLVWSWQLLGQTLAPNAHNTQIVLAASGASLDAVKQIARWVYLGTSGLVVVGYLLVVLDRRSTIDFRYIALATSAMGMLVASILLPAISIAYDAGRMYLQSLIVLAPFFVVGSCRVVGIGWHRVRNPRLHRFAFGRGRIAATALLLVSYFAFQVGLIGNLAGYRTTLSLDSKGPEHDALYLTDPEVAAAQWLHRTMPGATIFADQFGWMRLWSYGLFPQERVRVLPNDGSPLPAGAVVFLGSLNVTQGLTVTEDPTGGNMREVRLVLPLPRAPRGSHLMSIYDGGGAQVMMTRGAGRERAHASRK